MCALLALTILAAPGGSSGAVQEMSAVDRKDTPAMGMAWKRYDYERRDRDSDEIPSGTLVVVALCLVWGVLLLYLLLLHRRLRDQREELDRLRRQLEEGVGRPDRAPESTTEGNR